MTDVIKLAEFLFKTFLGQSNLLSEKSLEISAEILNQLRRILILIVLTLGSLALFCMGMSLLIERLLNNLDQSQMIMTPSIWFLLAFQALCVLTILYATQKSKWLEIFKQEKDTKSSQAPQGPLIGGQLESVLALLVMDFIKEREANRERALKVEDNK
jgi:hypothetical protein